MSNITFDCASLEKFADFFALEITNITTAVEACPEKCSLAWGTGNPDLSGIGVFVSYILQLAVCLLLGPCYAIIYRYLDKKRQKHIAQIHITALQTTLFLSCPIAVASIIDLKRRPTLFEASFIYHLNTMELLATVVLVSTIHLRSERGEAVSIQAREVITLILGFSLQVGLVAGVYTWINKGSFLDKEVQVFVAACGRSGMVVPILAKTLVWADNKYNRVLQAFLSLLMICLVLAAIVVWILALSGDYNPKYRPIIFLVSSTGLATGMAYSFVKMHLARIQLARLDEDGYEDNEWGFGQIVALFAWVPVAAELSLPLLVIGSRSLKPVWARVKQAAKRMFQSPQDAEAEHQAQHELSEQHVQHDADHVLSGQAGNRAVEEVQVVAGLTRRNTPRSSSLV